MTADQVVLALPFSILRASVDLSQAGFSPRSCSRSASWAWARTRSSTSSSRTRHWRRPRLNGETYADTGYQNTWEVTRAQPGTSGSSSTTRAATSGRASAPARRRRARAAVPRADRAGAARASRSSGTAARPSTSGRATRGPGLVLVLEGRAVHGVRRDRGKAGEQCHFCGEHTSIDFQGYLNGAVETGERAAREVIGDLARA